MAKKMPDPKTTDSDFPDLRTLEVDLSKQQVVPALRCGECDQTFAWIEDVPPRYCPMCGNPSYDD